MASSSSSFSFLKQYAILISLLLMICNNANGSCFTSMFSFGDSLTDTGNLLNIDLHTVVHHFAFPPYGQSYFHVPTGRMSDGRIIIDFIAEAARLPYLPPYFGAENGGISNFQKGVNFGVSGARAIDYSFWIERGIDNKVTNVSLGDELVWFKRALQNLCSSPSDCRRVLKTSLIIMGEIGGDDYNHPLMQGRGIEEVREYVPIVVETIGKAIEELIRLGAVTLVVPGNLPIGCLPVFLTYFQTPNKEEYDPLTGCLTWMNQLSQYHNQMLQQKLNQIRSLYPHVNIIYADYYDTAIRFYQNPAQFGFKETLMACCGKGGPYNYDENNQCGDPPVRSCCDDPSTYVVWDGLHLTEASNRFISKPIIEQLSQLCPSLLPPIPNNQTSVASS